MEHLTFVPRPCSEETRYANWAVSLVQDWTKIKDLMPFHEPMTTWLGFNHDDHDSHSTFEDYPSVHGWKSNEIWKGKLRDAHSSLRNLDRGEISMPVVSMLQSWFYHGLLEAVIGKHISVSYFVRQNPSGVACIYSRNIYFCLYTWMMKVRQLRGDDRLRESSRVLRTLDKVSSWIIRLNTFTNTDTEYFHQKIESDYPGFGELASSIIPSTIRLGEVIDCARLEAFGILPSRLSWHYPTKAMMAQKQELQDRGWCPFILEFVESTSTCSTIDWMTTLPPLPLNEGSGHRHCSKTKCHRNDIDVDTYKLSHDSRRCSNLRLGCQSECPNVLPDLGHVTQILANGCIPIIHINNGGGVSVSSQLATEDGEYVAISHMWADGLGSSTENGIPQCQALRLLDLVQRATHKESPGIWIDSLCIPKEPVARHAAIVLMKETYANACRVIVLDNGLRRLQSSSVPEVLMCAIYTSGWMQRLWTYQEAILAKKLTFELEDVLYDLEPLEIKRQGPTTPLVVAVVWRAVVARLIRLLDKNTKMRAFSSVSKDLNWRSTSRSTDEVLALSGVLGLDSKLLPIDTIWQWYEEEKNKGVHSNDTLLLQKQEKMLMLQEQRMTFALVRIRQLPPDIMFLEGPKLGIYPFRWAPLTLMNRSGLTLSGELKDHVARCDKDGLHGRWLVLTLHSDIHACRGTIFYVGMTHLAAVYRIFCKETWPEHTRALDSVIIDGSMPFGIGEIRQGLAILKRRSAYSTESAYESYDSIGQVLVENLQEAMDLNPSIMFTEPNTNEFRKGDIGILGLYIT